MFVGGFDPVVPDPSIHSLWDSLSPKVKDAAEGMIADRAVSMLVDGTSPSSIDGLESLLSKHYGHTNKVDEKFMYVFSNASGEMKSQMAQSIRMYLSSKSTSNLLSSTLKDDTVGMILLAETVARASGIKDIDQAWEHALNAVNKPGVEGQKLTPTSNRNLFDNMTEDAAELGSELGGRFRKTIEGIYSRTGTVSDEVYEQLLTYFENQQNMFEYKSKDGTTTRVQEVFGNGADPIRQLPEDFQDEARALMYDAAKAQMVKEGKSPYFSQVEYFGDIVVFKDDFGGVKFTMSVGDFVKEAEQAYMKKQAAETTLMDKVRKGGREVEGWGVSLFEGLKDMTRGVGKLYRGERW
jgi:hypothetical protein